MKKFQIQFIRKNGGGHFKYFEASENIGEVAANTANAYLEQQRSPEHLSLLRVRFGRPEPPIRTITVVEYDQEKKIAKRGGIKFKLRLRFVKYTVSDGSKLLDEWYEADEIPVTSKT